MVTFYTQEFMNLFYYFTYILLINTVLCNTPLGATQDIKEQWITIFVHGSIGVEGNLSYDLCLKLLNDSVLYSQYHINTETKRAQRNFYKNQAIGPKGLRKIVPSKKYTGASSFAQLWRRISHETETDRMSSYYTFGWSGILSHKMRYRESYVFYQELKKELEALKKQNIIPKIRIIGYSHGGNIALNLALIKRENFPNDTWQVDELILLGVPLQKVNAYEAYHGFFKKIYNIYSPGDYVQCLDIFSPYDFFSSRAFNQLKNIPGHPHIYDIELRMLQLHNKELYDSPRKDSINFNSLRKTSPGHFELWFFGWGSHRYRPEFCLYPLPIATLIPAIIDSVTLHGNEYNHIVLTIIPQYAKAYISNNFKRLKEIPFLSTSLIEECKRKALIARK